MREKIASELKIIIISYHNSDPKHAFGTDHTNDNLFTYQLKRL